MDAVEILKLIKGRRSVRRFTEKKVSPEALRTLIESAVWAPSGSNAQAWEFVVLESFEDKGLMDRLTPFLPGLSETPPAMIWLCVDMEKEKAKAGKLGVEVMGIMDISMAAQNIMLLAHGMGMATCAIRGFNEDVVRLALELPEHISPELLLVLGYPKEPGVAPARPPVEQNIHWCKFGNKSSV